MSAGETAPPPLLTRRLIVGISLVGLTIAHFTTDPHAHDLHNLLFKATYVPLILAGLSFRVREAMFWCGVTSGAYFVHLLQLGEHHPLWLGLIDIGLYNVVTLTTSVLSQRRVQALERAEEQARQLAENARALLKAEETIRRAERLSALGELAAGTAHELRNPLGGIRGAGEVLCNEQTPPEVRREFGELLETEIARLDRVVTDFLDFARPREPDLHRIVVAEVANAVHLLAWPELRRRQVIWRSSVDEHIVVTAEEGLLRQILLNLVLNALQALGSGGKVEVRARAAEGKVSIEVADDGPGVPPDLLERLFDPYVSGREGGSGLGLAIASRLAVSMGGSLELLASAPGQTVFRVVLPAG